MTAPAPRCTCGHTEAQHIACPADARAMEAHLEVGRCLARYCLARCKAFTPQTPRGEWGAA
jgi:hypothetical protein